MGAIGEIMYIKLVLKNKNNYLKLIKANGKDLYAYLLLEGIIYIEKDMPIKNYNDIIRTSKRYCSSISLVDKSDLINTYISHKLLGIKITYIFTEMHIESLIMESKNGKGVI